MNTIIPVVLSAIAAMILGFLWYGPLFSKQWMQLRNITAKDIRKAKKSMSRTYITAFVINLVVGAMLHYFIVETNNATAIGGAAVGLFAWLGFVMTTMGTNYLFTNQPRNLYLIDVGYYLAVLLVGGAIIGALA